MTGPPATHRSRAWRRPAPRAVAGAAALAGGVAAMTPNGALAHTGVAPAPHDLLSSWNLSLPALLAVVVPAWLYARGTVRIRRAATDRRARERLRSRSLAFGLGILVLAVALLSPLDLAATSLLSAHMLQHLLLLTVAPPLLVLAAPVGPILLGLPRGGGRALARWWATARGPRQLWRLLNAPASVVLVNVVVLWGWHTAPAYDLALRHEAVHVAEHASFLAAGMMLWWAVFQPTGRRRLAHGGAILLLLVTAIQGSGLGVLMTFAARPWYGWYDASLTGPWGLTPLQDQHLAGVVMWVPAGFVYLAGALMLLWSWLRQSELEARSAERPVASGRAVPVTSQAGSGGR